MNTPRSDAIFQIGDLLNNTFRIEAVLGRGGTSEVFRARNEISGRPVALKVLRSEFAGNDDFLVLMKREEQMRDIRHDAVVGYSEIHRTSDGHIYLVMDYVDGPSLETRLKQGGMPADEILTVGRRVSEGLRAAHARKIVHRDLSPDNIILRDGDPAQAVIIDFGIAKDTNPGAATIVGSEFAGKFSYAAPEQLAGVTDVRSDIYALGATLLATFRGKAPNVGTNLMEVVRIKNEPLDTSDLPEPLKAIIERMVAARPDERFQTCQQVLDAIPAPEPSDPERTTVVHPLSPAHDPATDTGASAPAGKPPAGRSRMPLVAVGALTLAAIAGGAWYSGVFESAYPVADPYLLTVEKPQGGVPAAGGDVPSPEIRDRLAAQVAEAGGASNLTLASGDIAEGWGGGILDTLDTAVELDSFRLNATGNRLNLTGETSDPEIRDAALRLFEPGALPDGMTLQGQIEFGPALVTGAMLAPVLSQSGDCGPLMPEDMPPDGYARGDTVRIAGHLSGTEARNALFDAVSAISGDREVVLDTVILNPALCGVEQFLPVVSQGGFGVEYSLGATGETNPSGRFFVGENPVIDVTVPPDVTTGYLYVSIVDVTGSVFHLLPNRNRTDNSIADLRAGATGALKVRVAYAVGESDGPDKLAFEVDDSLLGKSEVLILHTSEPLFDELRPTTESAEGYAMALEAQQSERPGAILSLDRGTLAMAQP
ncbi:protein kinase domain-containing protein [Tropicimonas sp.]|uniref:serine/threonine protein kinase n=1 Tax=Tropicimonas sp. TaxID=2067044 RepID=UPI003A8AAE9A